ncbi:hypothetical protein [Solimonas flava]|uniref:hypothetical protein n=1 Tax=Solimonas flava TaxID=415849 RepID=UPI0012B57CF2|nr:hypothetical protein [Solimonas flava]
MRATLEEALKHSVVARPRGIEETLKNAVIARPRSGRGEPDATGACITGSLHRRRRFAMTMDALFSGSSSRNTDGASGFRQRMEIYLSA